MDFKKFTTMQGSAKGVQQGWTEQAWVPEVNGETITSMQRHTDSVKLALEGHEAGIGRH